MFQWDITVQMNQQQQGKTISVYCVSGVKTHQCVSHSTIFLSRLFSHSFCSCTSTSHPSLLYTLSACRTLFSPSHLNANLSLPFSSFLSLRPVLSLTEWVQASSLLTPAINSSPTCPLPPSLTPSPEAVLQTDGVTEDGVAICTLSYITSHMYTCTKIEETLSNAHS